MTTLSPDLQLRLSGGAGNTNPQSSLGGVISSTQVTEPLFDDVSFVESTDGRTEHRIVYAYNNRSTTAKEARAFILNNTPSDGTIIEIGLGVAGMNGTEQALASEGAVPLGVTFTPAGSVETGLALGEVPAGQKRAIVLRRRVEPGTAARAFDPATIRLVWSYEE